MRNGFRKGLSLLLAAVLSLALVFAWPAAAGADDSGDISGTSKAAVTFTVNAGNGGGYFVLFGTKGSAYASVFDASGRFTGYNSEAMYGFFRILVTRSGYEQSYVWAPSATENTYDAERGQTLVITFPYAGDYTVVVTPLTRQEINGSYLPQNRFHYWVTDASWIISRSSNCGFGAAGGAGTRPAASGTVSVYCYDIARNYIQAYSETVTASTTLYPKEIPGYKSASSGQYVAFNNGTCNPATVFFYYMKEAAYGSVTVYCYDSNGQLIRQYTETVTASQTIYPQAISGYNPTSSGQYITFSGGACTPASVTFNYQKIQQGPATLTVNCYDENGNFIRTYTEQVSQSKTVYAQGISGYEVISPGQYVTYNNGTCSPTTVAFSYRKIQQYPATLTVNCYDENGTCIRTYTEQLTASKTVYPQAISGYNAASSSGQYITYSPNGTCAPSTVSFNYTKLPEPATLTIRCIDNNGTVIRTTTESITASKTVSPPSIAGYTALSGSQQVTYSNGTCSPAQVDFQYQIGTKVSPGSNPRMAYPTSWDTQFKPGTATWQNGTNARIFDKLWTMYDDSAGSSFYWVIYQAETVDNIPEFTAFFGEDTSISSIGIRNGNLLDSYRYSKYARVKRFEVRIYDKEGNEYKEVLNIPDGFTMDYREFPLSAVYVNVTRVEFWITGTADYYYGKDEGTNVCHLADIAFFK